MFELTNDLLIKILIFFLLFATLFPILKKTLFQENKIVSGVIALAVALIGTFYLSNSQIDLINQIYGMGGILLLIFLPFLIVFFFIYSVNITGVLRKMFWVFYGIVTFMILQNNNNLSSENLTGFLLLIVFLTIAMIFLDKPIQNQFNVIKNLKKQ